MADRERIKALVVKHRDVLNRLEPHLGCVVCRGPLVDGRCEACSDSGGRRNEPS